MSGMSANRNTGVNIGKGIFALRVHDDACRFLDKAAVPGALRQCNRDQGRDQRVVIPMLRIGELGERHINAFLLNFLYKGATRPRAHVVVCCAVEKAHWCTREGRVTEESGVAGGV